MPDALTTSLGRGRTRLTRGPAGGGAADAGRARCARGRSLRSLRAARGPFGFAASRGRLAPLAARPERWPRPPREMTRKGRAPFESSVVANFRRLSRDRAILARRLLTGAASRGRSGCARLARALRSLRETRGPIKFLAHLAKWARSLMEGPPLRGFWPKWAGRLMRFGPFSPARINRFAHFAKWAAALKRAGRGLWGQAPEAPRGRRRKNCRYCDVNTPLGAARGPRRARDGRQNPSWRRGASGRGGDLASH